MRLRSIFYATALAAVAFSVPSMANPPAPLPVPDPVTCLISDVSSAVQCVGYYPGNIFSNSPTDTGTQDAALAALGFAGSPDYATIFAGGSGWKADSLGGATVISFPAAPVLFGTTYVGVHWGGDAGGGQSAIYKLWLSAAVSSITIIGSNPGGSSAAVLYSTETPIPEPASWAMLIAGMGAVGFAMRRRRAAVSFA